MRGVDLMRKRTAICCLDRKSFVRFYLHIFFDLTNIACVTSYLIYNMKYPKECKIFIIFNNKISDMLSVKKSNLLVTELLVRGIKINISVAFIEQSYFIVPKNVRLYSTRDCIMKIPNKLQP